MAVGVDVRGSGEGERERGEGTVVLGGRGPFCGFFALGGEFVEGAVFPGLSSLRI